MQQEYKKTYLSNKRKRKIKRKFYFFKAAYFKTLQFILNIKPIVITIKN